MDRSYRFWNRMARRYASRPLDDEIAYLKKLGIMREHVDPFTDVLEIGCGTGSTALILGPHARHYLAIDFSQSMIDIARDKAARSAIDNVSFQCTAFEQLDAQEETFDVIIGQSVLHLMANWRSSIAQMHSLLRPGGIFISSTACLGDFMPAIRYIAPAGRLLGLLPRLSVFSLEDLRAALTDAGFTIDHEWQPGEKKGVFIVAFKAPELEEV
ncbi:MAG: class I SAM-dependent methyltransferase [Halioglobus sp.]|nr:class I SAM-dependent methyltransferase [Halioglobus sp.]